MDITFVNNVLNFLQEDYNKLLEKVNKKEKEKNGISNLE
jgi:hypothetical protein